MGNILSCLITNRTTKVSLLVSLIKNFLPIGPGLPNHNLEALNVLSVFLLPLLGSSEMLSNSDKSMPPLPKVLLTMNDTIKSKSCTKLKWQISYSYKSLTLHNNDGIRLENAVYLEVPGAFECETRVQRKLGKKLEFTERKHVFQRSKSWAKYHGSHVKNRPPRIHRRSRSDLGVLFPTPPNGVEMKINGSTEDDCLGRSG